MSKVGTLPSNTLPISNGTLAPVASSAAAATTSSASSSDTSRIAADKIGIYKHPLFPLLAILFEKCEKCTMQPDCPDAKMADKEIINFIKSVNRKPSSTSLSSKRYFTSDPELDDFMTKAVQVLRIHLMELEKVNELCQDFCSRYIHCLKGKMQSENLLRGPEENLPLGLSQALLQSSTSDSNSSLVSSPPPGEVPQDAASPSPDGLGSAGPGRVGVNLSREDVVNPIVQIISTPSPVAATAPILIKPPGSPISPTPAVINAASTTGVSLAVAASGHLISGSTVFQMVQTPRGLVAQPLTLHHPTAVAASPVAAPTRNATASPQEPIISGSTPLSKIGVPSLPASSNSGNSLLSSSSSSSSSSATSHSKFHDLIAAAYGFSDKDDEESNDAKNGGSNNNNNNGSKRGVLPKKATNVMRSWLFQHIVHPYPTEDEKKQIASQTNLTLLQVNNWFINARRRILQPMLDASNPAEAQKHKKSKPQNNSKPSAQRFWNIPDVGSADKRTSGSIAPGEGSSRSASLDVDGCGPRTDVDDDLDHGGPAQEEEEEEENHRRAKENALSTIDSIGSHGNDDVRVDDGVDTDDDDETNCGMDLTMASQREINIDLAMRNGEKLTKLGENKEKKWESNPSLGARKEDSNETESDKKMEDLDDIDGDGEGVLSITSPSPAASEDSNTPRDLSVK